MVNVFNLFMSLTFATLSFGIFLCLLGLPFLWKGQGFSSVYFKALRSPLLAGLFFGGGGLWFLWHVLHLGKADYGDYRGLLTILFGMLIVGSFFWVRDFLAVRGMCLVYLLCAAVLLDAAYAKPVDAKLLFVTCVYAGIFIAVYWAAVPYKARNFGEWLFAAACRARVLGAVLLGLGGAVCATALMY